MKHKIEVLVNGKWVQKLDLIETEKHSVEKGKHESKITVKKIPCIVNILPEYAKSMNFDSSKNGVRYIAIKEEKPKKKD